MRINRKTLAASGAVLAALTFVGCSSTPASEPSSEGKAAGNRGQVVIYSAEAAIDDFAKRFEDENPGIKVEVVHGSSGEILARVQAEAGAPQGDVWWGGGDVSTTYPELFDEYVSPSSDEMDELYKGVLGKQSPNNAFFDTFVYNKDLVAKKDVPKTWEDMGDPKWKGKISLADPASSSAAYLAMVNWVEVGGWDLVKKIAANVVIAQSSQAPFKSTLDGESAIGIGNEVGAYLFMGPDNLGIGYPDDGVMWALSSLYLIKDSPNADNAKKFIDWMLSQKTQQWMADDFDGMRPTNAKATLSDMTPTSDLKVLDYPSEATDEKEEWLAKWREIITSV